jgi:phosphopentomutase
VRGYASALERLDTRIPALEAALRPGDVALFTADHGCDPTAPGSDHTREYLPYVEIGARRGLATSTEGLDVVGRRMSELLVAKETAGRPAS